MNRHSNQIPLTPLEPWIAAKLGQAGRPLDLSTLHAYQLARLSDTVAVVQERSRFYRRMLGPAPLHLRSFADLAALPFTTADDLRGAPFDFLCVPQDEVDRIVTLPTSGTTGSPKRIFFTAADQDLTRDFFCRGMSTFVGPDDCVLILLPGSLPGSVGELLKDGLGRLGVRAIPHGPVTDPEYTLRLMKRERVTALVGIPVQVFWLASLSTTDPHYQPRQLHSVLLSTDRVPEPIARTIAETWSCDVYNHYGSTEMGLGGGVDCKARAGYHLREADLFFEIVDPASGQPLPPGETGEVVFTTLTRTAMPLIRYRTGDLSSFLPEACPCGSVLKQMAHVHERLGASISLPGGQTLSQRDFDEALFSVDGVADFRVFITQDGSARISPEGGSSLLVEVQPFTTGPTLRKEDVAQALTALPALAPLLARGQLCIEITSWDSDKALVSGTAKRKITPLPSAGD